jgi:hypothetical protein
MWRAPQIQKEAKIKKKCEFQGFLNFPSKHMKSHFTEISHPVEKDYWLHHSIAPAHY